MSPLPEALASVRTRLMMMRTAETAGWRVGAATELTYMLRRLPGAPIAAETLRDLDQLLSSPSTELQLEGIAATDALAAALLAEGGPDRFRRAGPDTTFRLHLAGGQAPSETLAAADRLLGPAIFDGAARYRRGWLRRKQDRGFEEILADEDLKRRVIWLVDTAFALPPERLPAFLRELFARDRAEEIPGLLGKLIRAAHKFPDRLVAWGMRRALENMTGRFLIAKTPEEAVARIEKLYRRGYFVTAALASEHVASRREAEEYVAANLRMINLLAASRVLPRGEAALTAGGVPIRHISLKVTAQTHRLDPVATDYLIGEVGKSLLGLFQRAKFHAERGTRVMVNIDPEEDYVGNLIEQIFWEAFTDPSLEGWNDAATRIQTYRGASYAEAVRFIANARSAGKRPQLTAVKGAYHLYEQIVSALTGRPVPVYLHQGQTDANFQRVVRLLLLNRDVVRPAIGSHNIDGAALALQIARELGLPITDLEIGLLHGVGEPIGDSILEQGVPVRYYGLYGRPPLAVPYTMRRLGEVTSGSAIGRAHISGSWGDYRQEMRTRTGAPPLVVNPSFVNVPEPDFSLGEVREAMAEAIRARERSLPLLGTPLLGEGEMVTSTEIVSAFNPADPSEKLGDVIQATEVDVEEAIRSAQKGADEWGRLAASERARILYRAAEIADSERFSLAALIVMEAGKAWEMAIGDVDEGIDYLRYYADQGMKAEAEGRPPLGVGAAIAPFNFFAIAMGEVAGGLAGGNAMILKPAGQTPLSQSEVVRILRQAGVPARAVQSLVGSGRIVGDMLVKSAEVDFIVFTGSEETGARIIRTAAKHPSKRIGPKVVVAETGGKNPILVDATADLDIAVPAILNAAFGYAGQRCSAGSRVIAQGPIYDRLLDRLIEGASSLIFGNPKRPEVQVGPQIDAAAAAKSHRYIEDALAIGERRGVETLAYGRSILAPKGSHFVGPHIFMNVKPSDRIAQEEIFGPVLAYLSAQDFDEMMEMANGVRQGLTAALISRDPANIRAFRRRTQAGNVYVNRPPVAAKAARQPFGGAKASGTGPKAGGPDYVTRFTHPPRRRVTEPLGVPAGLSREERDWALGQIRRVREEAAGFLVPSPTVALPGESNEIAHDWPLGRGLIWTEGETLADLVTSVAAALAMGNTVILPEGPVAQMVSGLFAAAGFSDRRVQISGGDPRELLQRPGIDFVVAHGAQAAEVSRLLFTSYYQATRIAPPRMIGPTDSPDDRRFLTRFAHARVSTVFHLRHGVELELKD